MGPRHETGVKIVASTTGSSIRMSCTYILWGACGGIRVCVCVSLLSACFVGEKAWKFFCYFNKKKTKMRDHTHTHTRHGGTHSVEGRQGRVRPIRQIVDDLLGPVLVHDLRIVF